jgi:hypothetical protein
MTADAIKRARMLATYVLVASAPTFAQPAPPAPVDAGEPATDSTETIHKLERQNQELDAKLRALGDRFSQQVEALQSQLDAATADAERARKLAAEKPTEAPSRFSLPAWVTGIEHRSDLRLRLDESVAPSDDYVTRARWRPRLRIGAVFSLGKDWEIGFRVASAPTIGRDTGGDPLSTNQTFEDNASRKPVGVDLAFARWTPLRGPVMTGSIAIGKLENPPNFTEAALDVDYTPEGAAETLTLKAGSHTASLYMGQFILDEISFNTNDPFLLIEQVRLESGWTKHVTTAFDASLLSIGHAGGLTTASIPDNNHGNTRDAMGTLTNRYQVFVGDVSVTFKVDDLPGYRGSFPITLFGEYIHNFGADADNTGYSFGPTFGSVSPRKIGPHQNRNWELSYRYQRLEGDYNYEELTASDNGVFYRSNPPNEPAPASFRPVFFNGTNLRGHACRLAFAPLDFLVVDFRIWRNEAIEVAAESERIKGTRFLFDLVWKF